MLVDINKVAYLSDDITEVSVEIGLAKQYIDYTEEDFQTKIDNEVEESIDEQVQILQDDASYTDVPFDEIYEEVQADRQSHLAGPQSFVSRVKDNIENLSELNQKLNTLIQEMRELLKLPNSTPNNEVIEKADLTLG